MKSFYSRKILRDLPTLSVFRSLVDVYRQGMMHLFCVQTHSRLISEFEEKLK